MQEQVETWALRTQIKTQATQDSNKVRNKLLAVWALIKVCPALTACIITARLVLKFHNVLLWSFIQASNVPDCWVAAIINIKPKVNINKNLMTRLPSLEVCCVVKKGYLWISPHCNFTSTALKWYMQDSSWQQNVNIWSIFLPNSHKSTTVYVLYSERKVNHCQI